MSNRMVKLARRPKGMVDARGLHDRGRPGAGAGRRRVPRQDRVHLARSGHARLDERGPNPTCRRSRIGEVMRGYAAGIVETSNNPAFKPGDAVQGLFGVQTVCDLQRRARRQGRHQPGAAAALDRRPRHAGLDGLFRPARGGPAQGRRDRGRVGGVGRGRLRGRPDRQDQGLPRGRHRRRARQMPLRHAGARLRRLRRLQGRQPRRRAEGRLPEGHRRQFRERRRRDSRHGAAADERVRAHRRVRADLRLQRHRGAGRAEEHPRRAHPAAAHAGPHRLRLGQPHPGSHHPARRNGTRRASSRSARTCARAASTPSPTCSTCSTRAATTASWC